MPIVSLADRPAFIPELARLHHHEWGYLRPGQSVEEREAALRRACGRSGIPTVVIAIDGDELQGSSMLVTHDMATRQDLTPWLAGVYVKAAHRRRGIATTLIRAIEDQAAALGVATLYLYTPSEAAFYARRGWETLERCTYRGVDVTVMHKHLPIPG